MKHSPTLTFSAESEASPLPPKSPTLWPTPWAQEIDDSNGNVNLQTNEIVRPNGTRYGASLTTIIHAMSKDSQPSPTPKSSHSPAPCITGTFPIQSALAESRMLHAIRCLSEQVTQRLALLRADSPANHTPARESDWLQRMNVTCGVSVSECFGTYDPATRCGKTSAGCCPPSRDFFSIVYCQTWPRAGTLVSGRLYQLVQLVPPTDETESGCSAGMSWPTATSRDHKDGTSRSCENVDDNGLLGRVIHRYSGQPSTATGRADPVKPSTDGNRQELWATPQVGMLFAEKCKTANGGQFHIPQQIAPMGSKCKLNPHWVMTLMGYPPLWAELGRKFTTGSRNSKAQATPSSPKSPPCS